MSRMVISIHLDTLLHLDTAFLQTILFRYCLPDYMSLWLSLSLSHIDPVSLNS